MSCILFFFFQNQDEQLTLGGDVCSSGGGQRRSLGTDVRVSKKNCFIILAAGTTAPARRRGAGRSASDAAELSPITRVEVGDGSAVGGGVAGLKVEFDSPPRKKTAPPTETPQLRGH